MGNKYPQTNEAKEQFKSKLLTIMKVSVEADPNIVFLKDELATIFSTSERVIRKEIEKIANYYPIISLSDRKGYRLATFKDTDSVDSLEVLLNDTQHAINELESRVKSLNARMKPLIALKEKLTDVIGEKKANEFESQE